MDETDRGSTQVKRSWWGFVVSLIGYVVGLIVVLLVLNGVDLFDGYPQQARMLVLLIPLVPFLVLLANYGWIKTISLFGIEIGVSPSPRSEPSPGRRTVILSGALLIAALGSFWRVVGFDGLITMIGSDSDDDETSTPTTTPTEAIPATTIDSQNGQSAAVDGYGEQRYGHSEYGG